MAASFGLDFGTTNSLIALVGKDVETGRAAPRVLLADGKAHPSVVSYRTGKPVAGRQAKDELRHFGLGVFGDVVRSPKMFLGTPGGIYVAGIRKTAPEVCGDVLRHIRKDALSRGFENPFENAVMSIPVAMDGTARAELREAAASADIHTYQFVHEPLAALYSYLRSGSDFRQQLTKLNRRIVLVFDWGGGTLDLTLCRIEGNQITQIFNEGDYDVGGDRFDERIVHLVRDKHESAVGSVDWSALQPSADARLIQACEDAKIRLSEHMTAAVFVDYLFDRTGPESTIQIELSRAEVVDSVRNLIRTGLGKIESLLQRAGLTKADVEFCLATGGMVAMPLIQQGLHEMFGVSRVQVPKNAGSLIAEGAAWIAHDDVHLELAKPIELMHADESYVPVIHEGVELPVEGRSVAQPIDMYCVDPRDGFAKFLFARPSWPGRHGSGDSRSVYLHLTLPVDPYAPPLHEVLRVQVLVDHDLIAHVTAISSMRKAEVSAQIMDLEFGLNVAKTVGPLR